MVGFFTDNVGIFSNGVKQILPYCIVKIYMQYLFFIFVDFLTTV